MQRNILLFLNLIILAIIFFYLTRISDKLSTIENSTYYIGEVITEVEYKISLWEVEYEEDYTQE